MKNTEEITELEFTIIFAMLDALVVDKAIDNNTFDRICKIINLAHIYQNIGSVDEFMQLKKILL